MFKRMIDREVTRLVEERLGPPAKWWQLVFECEALLKRFDAVAMNAATLRWDKR